MDQESDERSKRKDVLEIGKNFVNVTMFNLIKEYNKRVVKERFYL